MIEQSMMGHELRGDEAAAQRYLDGDLPGATRQTPKRRAVAGRPNTPGRT